MKLADLLANYRPGSHPAPWSWDDEGADLWDREEGRMTELVDDIASRGMVEPVLLGDDGRIWDGHHRIVAAVALDLPDVPTIEYAEVLA